MDKVCFNCKKLFGKGDKCKHCNSTFFLMKNVKPPSNSLVDPDMISDELLFFNKNVYVVNHPIKTFFNKIKFLLKRK